MNPRRLCIVAMFLLILLMVATITHSFASNDSQARLQVDFALDVLRVEKIAIMYEVGDDYSQGLAEAVKAYLENDPRGEVVLFEGIRTGSLDFSAPLLKIRQLNAEAIIFEGHYSEAYRIVSQMPGMRVDTAFIANDRIKDDNFITLAGDDAEGVYVTGLKSGGRYTVYQVQNGTFLELDVEPVSDDGWRTVRGTITSNGTPVCAMALANGQYMFTCNQGDDFGKYEMRVPLDGNGEITLQSFVSGLAPFRQVLDGSDLTIDIAMQASSPDSQSPAVTTTTATDAATPPGWARITGTVESSGAPLCAMVLANGQYMFSCGANDGIYDLTVPLDGNGQITLYVFVSGMQPYKHTFTP